MARQHPAPPLPAAAAFDAHSPLLNPLPRAVSNTRPDWRGHVSVGTMPRIRLLCI